MRLPVNHQPAGFGLLAVATVISVGGLLAAPLLAREPVATALPSGPAADYPMVLGAPFVVAGVTYTPADTMNIDQVGYAVVEPDAGAGISIAHRTLPLPSYVEITSLRTGRTILARAERRGPLAGPDLFGLSPAAAAQLGANGRTPVRVRRVNPPEVERALLRDHQTAPVRMDTPMPLVGVLLRKLDPALAPPPPAAPVSAPVAAAAPVPVADKPASPPAKAPVSPANAGSHPKPAAQPTIAVAPQPKPTPKPAPAPKPEPKPKPELKPKGEPKPKAEPRPAGKVVVQVGAFSTPERAQAAARQVGGSVVPSGKFYRVRITGFATPAEAGGALAKAKGAGYSDARIQRAD